VSRQPVAQEVDEIGFPQAFAGPEPDPQIGDLGGEGAMFIEMRRGFGIPFLLVTVLRGQILFGPEVEQGVTQELMGHVFPDAAAAVVAQLAPRLVEHLDQGAVLLVDLGNAGIELSAPNDLF